MAGHCTVFLINYVFCSVFQFVNSKRFPYVPFSGYFYFFQMQNYKIFRPTCTGNMPFLQVKSGQNDFFSLEEGGRKEAFFARVFSFRAENASLVRQTSYSWELPFLYP